MLQNFSELRSAHESKRDHRPPETEHDKKGEITSVRPGAKDGRDKRRERDGAGPSTLNCCSCGSYSFTVDVKAFVLIQGLMYPKIQRFRSLGYLSVPSGIGQCKYSSISGEIRGFCMPQFPPVLFLSSSCRCSRSNSPNSLSSFSYFSMRNR